MSAWSRRQLLGAGACTAALLLASCAHSGTTLPSGWESVVVGDLTLPVRSQWEHRSTPSQVGFFSDMWAAKDGGSRLLIGAPSRSAAPDDTQREVSEALRGAFPGYQPTTSVASTDHGDARVAYCDIKADGDVTGRQWVVTSGATAFGLALVGTSLSESDRGLIETSMSVGALEGAPSIPGSWVRVGRGGLILAVPRSWAVTGGAAGSQRWRAGWADVALDGTAVSRVLLAPSVKKSSPKDALAQLEADAIAGSLPGYKRQGKVTSVNVAGGSGSALRATFSYAAPTASGIAARAEGVMWAVPVGSTVAALQIAFSGKADQDQVTTMEKSLWVHGA